MVLFKYKWSDSHCCPGSCRTWLPSWTRHWKRRMSSGVASRSTVWARSSAAAERYGDWSLLCWRCPASMRRTLLPRHRQPHSDLTSRRWAWSFRIAFVCWTRSMWPQQFCCCCCWRSLWPWLMGLSCLPTFVGWRALLWASGRWDWGCGCCCCRVWSRGVLTGWRRLRARRLSSAMGFSRRLKMTSLGLAPDLRRGSPTALDSNRLARWTFGLSLMARLAAEAAGALKE